MEMPRAGKEHEKLESLAGSWRGEEKMYPSAWDPQGGEATARVQSRRDLDGFVLITDYVQERGGQVTYRGHGVFGFNKASGRYSMSWFDSMGGDSPAEGRWEGDTLTLQHAGPMGHARYTYELEGKEAYRMKIEQSQDGKQWATFMEGTYRRA